MTESSAEQRVRAAWERCSILKACDRECKRDISVSNTSEWCISLGKYYATHHVTNWYDSESEAWQAAWEFTEARLKLVAEIEEEIAWLSDGIAVSGDDEPIGARILAAEQARLADASRGLKGK